MKIEVYNMFGQKIYSTFKMKVTGMITQEINLGNYRNGIYLITIQENSKIVYSRKILKN